MEGEELLPYKIVVDHEDVKFATRTLIDRSHLDCNMV